MGNVVFNISTSLDGSLFTFVTDGVASAVAQAKAATGGRNVAVSTPSVLQ